MGPSRLERMPRYLWILIFLKRIGDSSTLEVLDNSAVAWLRPSRVAVCAVASGDIVRKHYRICCHLRH